MEGLDWMNTGKCGLEEWEEGPDWKDKGNGCKDT